MRRPHALDSTGSWVLPRRNIEIAMVKTIASPWRGRKLMNGPYGSVAEIAAAEIKERRS
jgi:hypothetical protein